MGEPMSGAMRQLPLGIAPRKTHSLTNFIAGDNGVVIRSLQSLVDHQGADSLYLFGAEGSGRSHLLQATCNAAHAQGRLAFYLPLASRQAEEPPALTDLGEGVLLAIDDIQTIAGNKRWEQALVAAYDAARLSGGKIVVSANTKPDALKLKLPDLESRLGWGELHLLQPLNDEGRLQFLRQKGAEAGMEISEEAGRYLLNRVSRDIPTLLDWLDRLDTASLAAKRRVTIPLIREVLASR